MKTPSTHKSKHAIAHVGFIPQNIKAMAVAAKMMKGTQESKFLASGLTDLVANITGGVQAPTINQISTLQANLRRSPLTFDRMTLSYLYMENGIIRTAIDQPVDDAVRGGVEFKSTGQVGVDEIKAVDDYFIEKGVWTAIKTTMKWGRLFGGAGLVINNGQDPSTELDLDTMNDKSPLKFLDADRWELAMPNDEERPETQGILNTTQFYYYTMKLHRSRVITVTGDTAPSLIRRMLMGWGLSEVEKMVRDLNQYIKSQDLIFDLLDEAKVDVFKVFGYHSSLKTPGGQKRMEAGITLSNKMKNYINALIMDKDDDFDQKQITFSGLAEMLQQIRIGIASTLRMPVTKLFGLSAAGFNSGEDDIENYNAMIESDIRSRMRPMIQRALDVVSAKLFGSVMDLTFDYKSLRIMSQNDEEDMKVKKQTRVLNNYDRGLLNAKQCMESQRKENLLSIEKTDAEQGLTEDFPMRPVDRVTQTIKTGEENPAEAEAGQGKQFEGKDKGGGKQYEEKK
jgi:phage-related protein (TIGR01555 family)